MTSFIPAGLGRRAFVTGTAGVGLAALTGLTGRASAATASDPATRQVVIVGANPGLQLFDGDEVTAYVSTWRVDWSPHGAGTAMVLWHQGEVHVYGADLVLASWLEREFTRFFPEVAELPWPEPSLHERLVHVDIDLARGMQARAGEVAVEMSDVLDRRAFATDDFPLGGVPHSLSLVIGPCGRGRIESRGRRLPGEPQVGGTPTRPSSSAFVTEAEVWRR